MVGAMTNRPIARLIATGMRDRMAEVTHRIARLNAIHLLEYDGEDAGFAMGEPDSSHDNLGRELSTLRSISDHVGAVGGRNPVREETARGWLGGEISDRVEEVSELISEMEALDADIAEHRDRIAALDTIASLDIDIDLLSGYENLAVFIGQIRKMGDAKDALKGSGALVFEAKADIGPVTATFCPTSSAGPVQKRLEDAQFSAFQPPEGEGSAIRAVGAERDAMRRLQARRKSISDEIAAWSAANGGMLVCGVEVLEADFAEATAPVRIAVSEHAFVLDGWITADRESEVRDALSSLCSYVEVDHDVGGALAEHHHSHDEEGQAHAEPRPPVDFGDHGAAKPMRLLTDAVGRSDYGRIDPTIFMLITYPLFFGMMLGDMLYGIITLSLAAFVHAKTKDSGNEMAALGVKFLLWIGGATVLFGYIYGEFAGFEILPHLVCSGDAVTATAGHALAAGGGSGSCHWEAYEGVPSWAFALSNLYPQAGQYEHHYFWSASLPLGAHISFPFHRVGGNIADLILLTIYIGVVHIMLALLLGAIDEVRRGHGWKGALYGKFSWMLVLGGGFFFAYAFLLSSKHTDPVYLNLLSNMQMASAVAVAGGVLLLILHLVHEGVPILVAAFLGPMEAIGMLPTTLSYVRLFAVGVVGVKIAEAGNSMIYQPMVEAFSSGGLNILVGLGMFVAWLAVQAFAWVLGMFSPNIHAARLHFVEWMRQFYQANGERFDPFGVRSRHVEVD